MKLNFEKIPVKTFIKNYPEICSQEFIEEANKKTIYFIYDSKEMYLEIENLDVTREVKNILFSLWLPYVPAEVKDKTKSRAFSVSESRKEKKSISDFYPIELNNFILYVKEYSAYDYSEILEKLRVSSSIDYSPLYLFFIFNEFIEHSKDNETLGDFLNSKETKNKVKSFFTSFKMAQFSYTQELFKMFSEEDSFVFPTIKEWNEDSKKFKKITAEEYRFILKNKTELSYIFNRIAFSEVDLKIDFLKNGKNNYQYALDQDKYNLQKSLFNLLNTKIEEEFKSNNDFALHVYYSLGDLMRILKYLPNYRVEKILNFLLENSSKLSLKESAYSVFFISGYFLQKVTTKGMTKDNYEALIVLEAQLDKYGVDFLKFICNLVESSYCLEDINDLYLVTEEYFGLSIPLVFDLLEIKNYKWSRYTMGTKTFDKYSKIARSHAEQMFD